MASSESFRQVETNFYDLNIRASLAMMSRGYAEMVPPGCEQRCAAGRDVLPGTTTARPPPGDRAAAGRRDQEPSSSARNRATCPVASTSYSALRSEPSGFTTNVDRCTASKVRPSKVFGPQTP